jgi:hypothetical protein
MDPFRVGAHDVVLDSCVGGALRTIMSYLTNSASCRAIRTDPFHPPITVHIIYCMLTVVIQFPIIKPPFVDVLIKSQEMQMYPNVCRYFRQWGKLVSLG